MRGALFIGGMVLLAGCGNPLDRVTKLSDLEVADRSIAVNAVPDAATETAQPEIGGAGFLGRLIGRGGAPETGAGDTPQTANIAANESGGDQSESEGAATGETIAQAPKRRGILGLIRGAAQPASAPDAPSAQATAQVQAATDTQSAMAPGEAPRQAGLLGLFRRNATKEPLVPDTRVERVALAPGPAAADGAGGADETTEPLVRATPRKRGLFARLGGGGAAPTGPDRYEVPFGTVLPYGQIARVCDTSQRGLGKQVAAYPERGRGYRIIDSDPGSTAPHTFYITGFPDGCARQFTAALALFGSAGMHERIRYGLPKDVHPYSNTDTAYEKIKRKVCRVGRAAPCGAKIGTLERNTVFISVYERFGENPRWADILLHDGAVVAKDFKGG